MLRRHALRLTALLRFEVEHLSEHHAVAARRAREHARQLGAHARVGVGLRPRQDLEGERQQRIAGKDRRPLVERLVHSRLAAPHVVIVHRRQVVVHERIAVHAFERRCRIERRPGFDAEQPRTLDDEERPEAFAAAEQRVAHGGVQAAALFRPAFCK